LSFLNGILKIVVCVERFSKQSPALALRNTCNHVL
jgi:hypothetical protein